MGKGDDLRRPGAARIKHLYGDDLGPFGDAVGNGGDHARDGGAVAVGVGGAAAEEVGGGEDARGEFLVTTDGITLVSR